MRDCGERGFEWLDVPKRKILSGGGGGSVRVNPNGNMLMAGITSNTDVDMIAERSRAVLDEDGAVLFAYLFGSVARGTAGPLSDIDIAVYLKDGADFVEEKLNLLDLLIDKFGTDRIDVVVLNTASLPLQARVLRCNRILLDRAPFTRHAFESLVLRKYFDFSRFEAAVLRRRFTIG
jgi:hypothetical protein